MNAILVNGPADGRRIEIPEAVESITLTAKVHDLQPGDCADARLSRAAGKPVRYKEVNLRYRRVGVRGQVASYIYVRTEPKT